MRPADRGNLSLYRLGFTLFMIEMVAQVVVTAPFYDLLKLVLRGWLLVRCGFLPRFLGLLSALSGFGWLAFLWPPLGARVFTPVALVAIAAVLSMAGWLLIRGVDDAKWKERAALEAGSIWR